MSLSPCVCVCVFSRTTAVGPTEFHAAVGVISMHRGRDALPPPIKPPPWAGGWVTGQRGNGRPTKPTGRTADELNTQEIAPTSHTHTQNAPAKLSGGCSFGGTVARSAEKHRQTHTRTHTCTHAHMHAAPDCAHINSAIDLLWGGTLSFCVSDRYIRYRRPTCEILCIQANRINCPYACVCVCVLPPAVRNLAAPHMWVKQSMRAPAAEQVHGVCVRECAPVIMNWANSDATLLLQLLPILGGKENKSKQHTPTHTHTRQFA